jgi:transposase
MSKDVFGCKADIEVQIKKISKKLKYHEISYTIDEVKKHDGKGRPKQDDEAKTIGVRVESVLNRNEVVIAKHKLTKGRFILATNQLDSHALSDAEILSTYKEQSGTESGFKFIKDDTFELDSVFLKKAGRISALMMIMVLCLMVYSYAQYFLREQLEVHNDTVTSQSNRETNKPSMKWVYRLFQGVCILKLKMGEETQGIVLNLNESLKRIITHFGDVACNIYGVAKV